MTSQTQPQPLYRSPGLALGAAAMLIGAAIGIAVSQLGNPLLAPVLLFAALVAIVTVIQPQVGLMILTVMTFSRLSDVLIEFHGVPSTAQPFILLVTGATALYFLRSQRRPTGWLTVTVWLVVYGVIIFASLFHADDRTLAQSAVEDYAKDTLPAILAVVLIQRPDALRRVLWALIAVGIGLGTLSVYQYITGSYDNNFWGFSQARESSLEGEGGYRIGGPFVDSVFYAQMLLLIVPVAAERMLNSVTPLRRAIAGYGLFITLLTILVTFSRGAFIALMIVGLVWLLRHPPKPVALGVGLILVAGILSFAPSNYTTRISTIFQYAPIFGEQDFRNEASFRGRSSELIVAWQMFLDHPLVGVGVGNYNANYLRYSSQLGIDPRLEDRSAHNLFLEIAAELGMVGLVAFVGILATVFITLRRAEQMLERGGLHQLAATVQALQLSMIGYLSAGFFLHLAFARPFWLMIGIALSTLQVARTALAERQRPLDDLAGRGA